jgi:large repetitive protein
VTGSAAGQNSFVAGAGSETFAQPGSGVGDRIDFSAVATSSSSSLTINVSGATVNGLATASARAGTSALYAFTSGGAAFTSFSGATSGNTTFLASGTGGYSFSAAGANDTVDFSAAGSGVNVNLSPTTEGGVPSGEASVPGGVDMVSGLTAVVGAASGGNTFAAGSAGPYTFTGAGTGNRFVAGTGNATFSDATPGNTVDFSALTIPVVVNVSGATVVSTLNDTATAGSATDTFTGLASPSTFIGATSGGTTFDAGTEADTFRGHGQAGDTLSYAHVSGGSLLVCAAGLSTGLCSGVPAGSTGKAVLSSVTEPFSGITVFDGLTGGNTAFVSGSTGGYTFNATGTGNTADFSAATAGAPGVSVDLSSSPATVSGFAGGGPDAMTGITSVTGSAAGQNSFVAGAGSETFAQPGSGVGDRIDFSAVATSSSSPLTINVSGATVNGLATASARAGTSALYAFTSGGAAFTSFTGATSGNTTFLASGTGGYRYMGKGTPNTLNLSAAPTGTVVTVNGNSIAQPGSVTKLTAGTGGATSDAFADVQFFVGHVSIVSPVKAQPSKPPHASVGAAYMQQLAGAGGTGPYADWSVESGSLPPGLVLSPSGLLSGTPTLRGSFTFVVTLVDAHNVPGATTLTLVVNPHTRP